MRTGRDQELFRAGELAQRQYLPIGACPYPAFSQEWSIWRHGWKWAANYHTDRSW